MLFCCTMYPFSHWRTTRSTISCVIRLFAVGSRDARSNNLNAWWIVFSFSQRSRNKGESCGQGNEPTGHSRSSNTSLLTRLKFCRRTRFSWWCRFKRSLSPVFRDGMDISVFLAPSPSPLSSILLSVLLEKKENMVLCCCWFWRIIVIGGNKPLSLAFVFPFASLCARGGIILARNKGTSDGPWILHVPPTASLCERAILPLQFLLLPIVLWWRWDGSERRRWWDTAWSDLLLALRTDFMVWMPLGEQFMISKYCVVASDDNKRWSSWLMICDNDEWIAEDWGLTLQ